MRRFQARGLCAAAMGFFLLFYATATEARTPATVQIAIKDFDFTPGEITVAAGTTVVWTNMDDEPHLVIGTTGVFQSAALDTNEAFRFTFDAPGSYAYFCSLHPHMKGVVKVIPAT